MLGRHTTQLVDHPSSLLEHLQHQREVVLETEHLILILRWHVKGMHPGHDGRGFSSRVLSKAVKLFL